MNKLIILAFFLLVSCNYNRLKEPDSKRTESISQTFPKQTGYYVNDYENVLTEKQKKELNDTLQKFDIKTNVQILILSVPTIKPYTDIHKYSVDLGNNWNLAQKSILIVLSKQNRNIAIATTVIAEKILTDSLCKSIIDYDIVPELKKDNYYKGLEKGAFSIMNHFKKPY